MRIHLILSTLLLFSLSAFSQYNIRGEVLHHEGQILLLAPTLSGACDTLGNAVTVDGAFSFKGMIYQPAYAEIQIVGVTPSFPIFLEKGNFEFKVDVQHPLDYEITGGGELQCLRNEFKVKELNLKYERDSIYAEYKKQYEKGDLFGDMQIRDLFQKYEELYSKTEDEFIREHDNLVSVSLIAGRYKKLLREKTLPGKYALLGEKARNSIQGQWLKPYVDKITRIIPGGIAPDLEMQTPEGKIMSVYSVKSKVKILDFWASWCGPCRAENPNMRMLYEQYKERGLEIISISLDKKNEAWKKAIKDDKLSWKHMSDLKGWNSAVTDVYEIHAIPYLFVLDQNNRIIAEGIRGEELEKCVIKALKIEMPAP